MSLLVIEAEPVTKHSLATGLRQLGYDLETAAASNYGSALNPARAYTTIVIDLEHQGSHGLLLLHELRDTFPDARILVLSPSDSVQDRVLSLIQGADEILVKPFDLAGLHAVLQDYSATFR